VLPSAEVLPPVAAVSAAAAAFGLRWCCWRWSGHCKCNC